MIKNLMAVAIAIFMFPTRLVFHTNLYVFGYVIGYAKGLTKLVKGTA